MKPTNFLRSAPTNTTLKVAFLGNLAAANQSRADSTDPEIARLLLSVRGQMDVAIDEAERAVNEIESKRKTALFSIGTDQYRRAMDNARQVLNGWLDVGRELAGQGTIAGRTPTLADYERVLKGLGTAITNYGEAVETWNSRFVLAVAGDVLGGWITSLAETGSYLYDMSRSLLDAVGTLAKVPGKVANTLGWLVPVGIVALLIGPTLLRGASAARSGADPYAAVGDDLAAARSGIASRIGVR